MPARPLYRQRVPGWKSSGTCANRAAPSRQGRPRPARPEQLGAALRWPIPPLARPEVCVIRSRMVTSRSAGTSWTSPSFSTATLIPLNSGMNLETGSVSPTLPSSISMRIATPVTGLVEEAMRKIASLGMGEPDSTSITPRASWWMTRPCGRPA